MRSEFYTQPEADKIACLIVGFGGRIAHYEQAIKDLQKAGFNVVAYEYDSEPISRGAPEPTLALIRNISADFLERSKSYKAVLYAGASLGAFMAYNVQRLDRRQTKGMYATAGVPLSYCVFHALVFRPIRKRYQANGYDESKLFDAWKTVEVAKDEPPKRDLPFVVVMGKRDKIVNYRVATNTLHEWNHSGQNIHIITKKALGHTGTIRWYKKNIPTMLKAVELLQ